MGDTYGCTCATIDPFATEHRELCPMRKKEAGKWEDVLDRVSEAKRELDAFMKMHGGDILRVGSSASVEFDRLYIAWIQARWDVGDRWVRDIWKERP